MQRLEREPLLGEERQPFYGLFRAQASSDWPEVDSSTSSATQSVVSGSSDDSHRFPPPEDLTILQACVFVEDAVQYRSIHHKVDERSLKIYRLYYSLPVQWFLNIVIVVLHLLAFLEFPSSLVLSTDPRQHLEKVELPCGFTESIESFCLLVLLADVIVKIHLRGTRHIIRNKWLIAYVLVMVVSMLDWCVSLGYGCSEPVRVRRMLRPFFVLQNSSLMKKTVNCLRRTLPQVISVLMLLCIHIYFFTLFGMLLFPKQYVAAPITPSHNVTEAVEGAQEDNEQNMYFNSLSDSLTNLLVLLTTANNPDVMMPAYSSNRFYSIYFILFLAIGMYCFMNMLTAVIYNQFRGYFLNSMQGSLFRRRLGIRAAFEVLRPRNTNVKFRSNFDVIGHSVPVTHLRMVIDKASILRIYKDALFRELDENMGGVLTSTDFQDVFTAIEMNLNRKTRPDLRDVRRPALKKLQAIGASKYFTYLGCFVALGNVVCISVELATEYDQIRSSSHTVLGVLNMVFILYYLLEQSFKLWALGWKRYRYEMGNIFDGLITLVLVVIEVVYVALYGVPMWGSTEKSVTHSATLWNLVRIINMLIMIRLLRIVTQIKAMSAVVYTLVDLVKNLKAFAGILLVLYYSYALLGMELFRDKIPYDAANATNQTKIEYKCGSYEQLEYWANNFNDFGAALVVLWDIMVVNNWHVFLQAYTKYVNVWSKLYFIGWWLLTVVIGLNLFTALILENFIMRWDRLQTRPNQDPAVSADVSIQQAAYLTVHDMFRGDLQEPSEDSLLTELRQHSHLEIR